MNLKKIKPRNMVQLLAQQGVMLAKTSQLSFTKWNFNSMRFKEKKWR